MSRNQEDILLRMHRLKHQQRPPQIPPALLRNPRIQLLGHRPPLFPRAPLQHLTDLYLRGRRNSYQQRPAPNRCNNIRRAVRQQYQPQIWTVLLHCPPQRRLRIPRQMIRLVDDHDLESLFRALIDLLRLRHLLQ